MFFNNRGEIVHQYLMCSVLDLHALHEIDRCVSVEMPVEYTKEEHEMQKTAFGNFLC